MTYITRGGLLVADFYLGLAAGALAALAGVGLAWRPLTDKVTDPATYQIMTKPYDRNLWELFYALQRASPHVVVETALRAEQVTSLQP